MEALKANELRTENLLMRDGEVVIIDSIQQSLLSVKGTNYWELMKDFEPIPLTKDWLIRAGFVRHNYERVFYSISYGTNGVAIVFFDTHYNKFCYQLGTGHNRVIDYVHQLQGLHFYVTGFELEFKPK